MKPRVNIRMQADMIRPLLGCRPREAPLLMIIWLNGPFGVGKTQTAHELHSRLPGSFVFDPERIGYTLYKLMPREMHKHYQDYPVWREFTAKSLRHVAENFSGVILVPMTVVNSAYLDEIVGTVCVGGPQLHHFSLLASRETIVRRLRGRGEGLNAWGTDHLQRCLSEFPGERFATQIHTEGKSIEAVAEEIADHVGLSLKPPTWPPPLRPLQRIAVQLRQLRA